MSDDRDFNEYRGYQTRQPYLTFQEYIRLVVDQKRSEEFGIWVKFFGGEAIQAVYEGTRKFTGIPLGEVNGKS